MVIDLNFRRIHFSMMKIKLATVFLLENNDNRMNFMEKFRNFSSQWTKNRVF